MTSNFGYSVQIINQPNPGIELQYPFRSASRRQSLEEQIPQRRHPVPLGPDLRTSFQVEHLIVEPRLPGAAVDLDAIDDHFLVLEIDAVGQDLFTGCQIISLLFYGAPGETRISPELQQV